jgi:hypothetical protein
VALADLLDAHPLLEEILKTDRDRPVDPRARRMARADRPAGVA